MKNEKYEKDRFIKPTKEPLPKLNYKWEKCTECNGKGKIDNTICPKCYGDGRIKKYE